MHTFRIHTENISWNVLKFQYVITQISWLEIGKKMRTKKEPSHLRNRADRLKQRFGRDFAKRPNGIGVMIYNI
jgi:hypothetical protein